MTYDPDQTVDAKVEDLDLVFMRAVALALPAYELYNGRESAAIPDAAVVAVAFLREALAPPTRPALNKCSWCVQAAGDTEEAWQAARSYSIEEVRAHVLTCAHNPLVEQISQMTRARVTKVETSLIDLKRERDEARAAERTIERLTAERNEAREEARMLGCASKQAEREATARAKEIDDAWAAFGSFPAPRGHGASLAFVIRKLLEARNEARACAEQTERERDAARAALAEACDMVESYAGTSREPRVAELRKGAAGAPVRSPSVLDEVLDSLAAHQIDVPDVEISQEAINALCAAYDDSAPARPSLDPVHVEVLWRMHADEQLTLRVGAVYRSTTRHERIAALEAVLGEEAKP